MFDSFLDFLVGRVFPVLALFLSWALCYLVGLFPANDVQGGPAAVLLFGLLAAAIMSGLFGYLSFLFLDIDHREHRKAAAIIIGIGMAVGTLIAPFSTLLEGHEHAAYLREMAPKVQSFALKYFDQIDTDHNQLITDEEMKQALNRLSLNDEERTVLALMRTEQSEVGHVIDSYKTTSPVIISTGKSLFVSHLTTTHYIYGVNREDLNGYPERVREKYKKW